MYSSNLASILFCLLLCCLRVLEKNYVKDVDGNWKTGTSFKIFVCLFLVCLFVCFFNKQNVGGWLCLLISPSRSRHQLHFVTTSVSRPPSAPCSLYSFPPSTSQSLHPRPPPSVSPLAPACISR